MSRIGKAPVVIPESVQVTLTSGLIKAKGPMGELVELIHPFIHAEIKEGKVFLTTDLKFGKEALALHGTTRARINNLVTGVFQGFSKVLNIIGLGYRAEMAQSRLTLTLGKSHPIEFEIPAGVTARVDAKKTQITLSSPSKDLLGETAARIRALRKPEHYKGTGIRYLGEVVRKKAGKTAAGAGGEKK